MKKNAYQDIYNMDRDLIWEAYGQVQEQEDPSLADMTGDYPDPAQPVAAPAPPGQPVAGGWQGAVAQADAAVANGAGTTGGEVQQQIAALEIARNELDQVLPGLGQQIEADFETAKVGNPVEMDPSGNYKSQMKFNAAKAAWTRISQHAQQLAPAARQFGIHMGTLLEALLKTGQLIKELHSTHRLVIDEQLEHSLNQLDEAIPAIVAGVSRVLGSQAVKTAGKEALKTAAVEGGARAGRNIADKLTGDEEQVEEEGYDKETEEELEEESCDHEEEHPGMSHKEHKKMMKGDVQKENCPFADDEELEDGLELSDLELDKEDDAEGRMAKKDLYKLAKYASKLHNRIEDGEDLEGWVQNKIAKAADYLNAVYHYMDDQDEPRDEDDEHGYVELGDMDEGPYYQ